MVFVGIYRAVYDYAPQDANELGLTEGDLLMVLDKTSDDDWWKAKKKGTPDEEEEPEGLIPNNYVEEAAPIQQAKALYDYTRQTDEELSFKEDALLDVYDVSDPDWTLVGVDGDYGFAPANYIDVKEADARNAAPSGLPSRPPAPAVAAPDSDDEQQPPTPESPPHQSPAAALAGIIQKKSEQTAGSRYAASPPPSAAPKQRRVQFTPEESDEEIPAPRLPQRPPSEQFSPPPTQYATPRSPSPPPAQTSRARAVTFDHYDAQDDDRPPPTPQSGGGYHLYNIYEYITQPGKNKKMPITLGINIPKGMIMVAPEKSRDGPQQEWSADKLEYYSQEGKHVFVELKRPSKSVDFHCGAKDTATEIVAALGELSGAAKGAGLREVLAAGSGNSNVQKKGVMLFDFVAQGDDEVSVDQDDEILVLDDSASEEWWKVRRLKNGKEGVVPANYVEIRETVPVATPAASLARSGTNAGRSVVEQNRREEEELARQAVKSRRRESGSDQRSKRDSTSKDARSSSKPNPAKVRTWTDRSGSFKVEAEFLTVKDGKIHLHKINGVKIAVPVPKMSVEDLEYVEQAAGISLDDDKPLSEIKRRNTQRGHDRSSRSVSGITVEQGPSYDWFDFFLQCGVNPQICERYAQVFARDQMGEENMPDISEKLLRTLGLKEGDILRVMKFLDAKYGRTGGEKQNGDEGGLFSGPGGTLRNNTRKGRPAPAVQTNDIVDAKAFEQKTDDAVKKAVEQPAAPAAASTNGSKVDGFEDDAWNVKPSKQVQTPAVSSPAPAAAPAVTPTPAPPAPAPPLTGAMGELSLLDMPALKPEVPAQPTPAPAPQAVAPPAPQAPAQPQGASQSLFDQVAAVKAMAPSQMAPPRARPTAPQQSMGGGLIAPPPQRAASAPQNPQSAFGPPPLQPQLTGLPSMQTQVAPPGQSLQDLGMQRFQQQQMTGFNQAQPQFQFPQQQQNGLMPQPTGYNGLASQQTGFGQPMLQPQPTGFAPQFAPQQQPYQQTGFQQPMQQQQPQQLQMQPTGYGSFSPSPLNPQATGVNRFLPPAIQPQPTGFQQQQPQMQQQMQMQNVPPLPPMPPMPSMPAAQPLVPQRTGPAPAIKFGVQPAAKKLVAQPTGRANLAKATPENPFGF